MSETKNIYQKLLAAQMEIGAIKKDSDNPFFKSKYFDINAILREVKPILNKYSLILLQSIQSTDGRNGVVTEIMDAEDGKIILSSKMTLPEVNKPQELGSAITYFRRYAIQSLLALEAEDDDGNVASGNSKVYAPTKTQPQAKFEESLKLEEEDLIKYEEKLGSAKDLKELKKIWESLPGLAKDKLEGLKEDLKFKLN